MPRISGTSSTTDAASFWGSRREITHSFQRVLTPRLEKGEATEHDIEDPKDPRIHHFFRFVNGIPLNASNQDLLVNVLEYWEQGRGGTQHFCWITDFMITKENAYSIMRGGRARWKVENETFNTLKNQGYHCEHNFGLGQKNLSLVFLMLMFLAFLADQVQQLACPLFQAAWKVSSTKRELWENMRSIFRYAPVESMENALPHHNCRTSKPPPGVC